MKLIIISVVAFVVIIIAMLFLKTSRKKKALFLTLFILLYGLFCVPYLPKKLSIKDGDNTYITLELGSKEVKDVVEKGKLINIIEHIEFHKGNLHYDLIIQDLSTINVVSDKMYLSGKKVTSAYFNMIAGQKYGIVDIDQKPYYFLQKELLDAVNKH